MAAAVKHCGGGHLPTQTETDQALVLSAFPEPVIIDFDLSQAHLLWSSEHDSYYEPKITVADASKVTRYSATAMPQHSSDRFIDLLFNPPEPGCEAEELIVGDGHHRLAAAIARKETSIAARVHMPLMEDGCVASWPTMDLY